MLTQTVKYQFRSYQIFAFFFYLWSFDLLANKILISEIGTENGRGIIELYNASSNVIDLAGYRLEADTDTSVSQNPSIFCLFKSSDGIIRTDTLIEPYGYFLVCDDETSLTNIADFIITKTTSGRGRLDENDTIFLGIASISGPSDNDIVDFVGMGENNPVFSGDAPAETLPEMINLENDKIIIGSIERKAREFSTLESMSSNENNIGEDYLLGNSYNTGHNAQDFILRNTNDFQNKNSLAEDWTSAIENNITNELIEGRIVFSEIMVAGETADEEFVEIYNRTDQSISLANWGLYYKSSSGNITKRATLKESDSIQANGYYLIGGGGINTNEIDLDKQVKSLNLSSLGFELILRDNFDRDIDHIRLSDNTENGSLLPPAAKRSIERKAYSSSDALSMMIGKHVYEGNAYFDSNQNNLNESFILRENPQPQSSKEPIEPFAPISNIEVISENHNYGNYLTLTGDYLRHYIENESEIQLDSIMIDFENKFNNWTTEKIEFQIPAGISTNPTISIQYPIGENGLSVLQIEQLFALESPQIELVDSHIELGQPYEVFGSFFGYSNDGDIKLLVDRNIIFSSEIIFWNHTNIEFYMPTHLDISDSHFHLLISNETTTQNDHRNISNIINSRPLLRKPQITFSPTLANKKDEVYCSIELIDLENDLISNNLQLNLFHQEKSIDTYLNKSLSSQNLFVYNVVFTNQNNVIISNVCAQISVSAKTGNTNFVSNNFYFNHLQWAILDVEPVNGLFIQNQIHSNGIYLINTNSVLIEWIPITSSVLINTEIIKYDLTLFEIITSNSMQINHIQIDDLQESKWIINDLTLNKIYQVKMKLIDRFGNQSEEEREILFHIIDTNKRWLKKFFSKKTIMKENQVNIPQVEKDTQIVIYDQFGIKWLDKTIYRGQSFQHNLPKKRRMEIYFINFYSGNEQVTKKVLAK